MLRNTLAPSLAGATSARPLGSMSGVRPGTPSNIVTATASLYTVTPFAGIIDLEGAAIAGPYSFAFPANVTGAVTTASASIIRKDIVYVQINDGAEGDGTVGAPNIKIDYLAGSVASTAPTTPARSFVIAEINVPILGGGSPTVTWVAPYAVAAGATLPVPDSATLTAYTPMDGQFAYRIDNGITYKRVSGAWKAWESGWISYTSTTTNLTIGTGGSALKDTKYRYVAGDVEHDVTFILGTVGGAVVNSPSFTTGVTMAAVKHANVIYSGKGSVILTAASGSPYAAVVHATGTSATTVTIGPDSGTAAQGAFTASSPFTFTAGSVLQARFVGTPA